MTVIMVYDAISAVISNSLSNSNIIIAGNGEFVVCILKVFLTSYCDVLLQYIQRHC